MKKEYKDKIPNEVPTKKIPHRQDPLKYPLTPNEKNPINPKEDVPLKKNN